MLVVTDDPEAIYGFWNSQSGDVPVSSTSEIGANTSVEAIVFFVGCEPNRQGDCEVWGTATVVAPDGSFLADRIDVPLWVGRPPPPGRALGISEHGVGMRDESAPGTYVFRIVVTDRVSGREVSLEQSVAVVQ